MKSNLNILFLLILFYCLDYFFRISPSLVVPELQAQLNANTFEMGALASGFYLGYVCMQIPSGILLDRVPLRTLMIPVITLCTLLFIAFIYTTQPIISYWLRVFIGGGSAFAFIGVLFFTRQYFPDKWFVPISGITISMGTISASFIEILCAKFAQHMDWHLIFTVFASIGLLIGGCLLRLPFKHLKKAPPMLTAKDYFLESRQILGCKPLIINGLIGGLLYLPTSLLASLWGVPFLMQVYHFSKVESSVAISVLFLGWIIGSVIISFNRRMMENPVITALFSALLAAFLSEALLSGQLTTSSQVHWFLGLIGFFSSSQVLIWQILKKHCTPHQTGLASSFTNMLILLQAMIFHLIVGYITYTHGETELSYIKGLSIIPWIFGVVCIISTIQWIQSIKTPQVCP